MVKKRISHASELHELADIIFRIFIGKGVEVFDFAFKPIQSITCESHDVMPVQAENLACLDKPPATFRV